MGYSLVADLVVIVHLVFAGFVLIGFFSLVVGSIFGWAWTYGKRFRIGHLLCIVFVALEGITWSDLSADGTGESIAACCRRAWI